MHRNKGQETFSQWREVSSGVTQGFVLGLMLFNWLLNYLELGQSTESSEVAKCAGIK